MKKILIGCLSLVLLSACNKEVKELPDPSQSGANTFGAKVNGVLWAPRGFGPFPANDILVARFITPTSLIINARNFASSPTETEFEIQITNVTGPGVYLLDKDVVRPTALPFGYYVKRTLSPENEWQTSSTRTGSVTITKLDIHNKVVAGTFEFTAADTFDPSNTISVTEGRFDIKLQ